MDDALQNNAAYTFIAEYIRITGSQVYWTGLYYPRSQWGPSGIGLTNYMGVAGLFATVNATFDGLKVPNYKGPMLYVTKAENNLVTLESLTSADGASNTLMFGEMIGASYPFTPRDGGFTWIAAGANVTYWCIPSSLPHVYWNDWSSKHASGIVNFVMGDGSVRPVQPSGRDDAADQPYSPATPPEQAFWAISGFADGDNTRAEGITP